MSGINQEIWTDVLVQDFTATEDAGFLNEIPDSSHHVTATRNENDIIHLIDVGADPEVFINNIPTPIGYYTQEDGDIPIKLDTYVTKATRISIEETQYITYDKIRLVQQKHKRSVMANKHRRAAHNLAPEEESSKTPILTTTGEDDGTGRKRLVPKNLLTLKNEFDIQKIPLSERVLVLTSDHYNDLLYYFISRDKPTGHLSYDEAGLLTNRLEGFKTYLYIDAPLFDLNSLKRKSFGALKSKDDVSGSFAFHNKDAFKAKGRTFNITDPINTQTHSSFYNVRHNYIVSPIKKRGRAAILSAKK